MIVGLVSEGEENDENPSDMKSKFQGTRHLCKEASASESENDDVLDFTGISNFAGIVYSVAALFPYLVLLPLLSLLGIIKSKLIEVYS